MNNLRCYCGICLPWGDPDPVERVALMSVADTDHSDDHAEHQTAEAVAMPTAASADYDTTDEG